MLQGLYFIRLIKIFPSQATCLPLLVGRLWRNLSSQSLLNTNECSDIATASIGPRSIVATGPEEIQSSKWELEADMERFIETAEVCLDLIETSS